MLPRSVTGDAVVGLHNGGDADVGEVFKRLRRAVLDDDTGVCAVHVRHVKIDPAAACISEVFGLHTETSHLGFGT